MSQENDPARVQEVDVHGCGLMRISNLEAVSTYRQSPRLLDEHPKHCRVARIQCVVCLNSGLRGLIGLQQLWPMHAGK